MELNRNHRRALLDALDKAKNDMTTAGITIHNTANSDLKDYLDIDKFLAFERIHLIEKALEENEIDF